jgi:phosphatidylserine/phosphatidylglycerophosphate/cardiolipin synthase-like enzyme
MNHSILEPGRNCREIRGVGQSGILIDARDYYLAFSEAAAGARSYLLLAGWQFDSRVKLRRGEGVEDDHELVSFLDRLSEKNRNLRIYILAWDFSIFFAMEREWMQEWLFNWKTGERVQFRFDRSHPFGASHHQKFAVIDGIIGFVGGIDICEERWDESPHRDEHPLRVTAKGKVYAPSHDIQAAVTGPIVRALTEVFEERWKKSGGEDLVLPPPREYTGQKVRTTIAIPAERAALSLTQSSGSGTGERPIREIRTLYSDAIMAAARTLYFEHQYFTSQAICDALVERMKSDTKNRLEIIVILPEKPQGFLEKIAILEGQRVCAIRLRQTARETGHRLGMYFTTAIGRNGAGQPTHIHSKLLIVDDRFITIGSANATNRSMGLDTELGISFEASPEDRELSLALRRIRSTLLHEHSDIDMDVLMASEELLPLLEECADKTGSRLHRHPLMTMDPEQKEEGTGISPMHTAILDGEEPITVEGLSASLFPGGIAGLQQLFSPDE